MLQRLIAAREYSPAKRREGMKVETYQAHKISASGWPTERTESWRSHVIIVWWDGGFKRAQPFTCNNQVFPSEEDAEAFGLSFAKTWIDDGKPDRVFSFAPPH